MTDKKYVKGTAKAVKTQYGQILNLSLNFDELAQLPHEDGYIKISVMQKKEVDQWGNTHYVVENDYVPEKK